MNWWNLAQKLILESQAGLEKNATSIYVVIHEMAFTMLGDIAKNINDDVFFSITADKAADSSNNEQLVVCIRWVENDFEAHDDFIGLNAVENIKPGTLVPILRDILIRLNIPLSNCLGLCYDGASDMRGIKEVSQHKFSQNHH